MTREEAIYKVNNQVFEADYDTGLVMYPDSAVRIIKEIYDDFESRVCGNCEHFNNFYKTCRMGYAFCIATKKVREDFGCNKFKRKRDESIQI